MGRTFPIDVNGTKQALMLGVSLVSALPLSAEDKLPALLTDNIWFSSNRPMPGSGVGLIYRDMKIEGGKIRLSFDHTGSGLVAKDGTLANFMIAGGDRKFVPAKAVIHDKAVVVSSDTVTAPVAVRYAFDNAGVPSLCNKEGLPAPFRPFF